MNLQRVIAVHGTVAPSYADLYFGSTPFRDSDYYWSVLAAEHVMHLYRRDPAALAYEAHLQARKNSSEEVLHPRPSTPQFMTPDAIARAWRQHVLRAIPRDPGRTHVAISRFLGEEAHKLGRSPGSTAVFARRRSRSCFTSAGACIRFRARSGRYS